MSSRALLLAALAACSRVDAPTIVEQGQATVPQVLDTGVMTPDGASFRWTLEVVPAGSHAAPPQGDAAAAFTPDLRGAYAGETWMNDGLADDLVARFEVDADGMPPVSVIDGVDQASVGQTVALDGSRSESAEGLAITLQWRLTSRPRASVAILSATTGLESSFVADVNGDFTVELTASDGQLWGEPKTETIHVVP